MSVKLKKFPLSEFLNLIVNLILLGIVIVSVYPFFWMITCAFKTNKEIFQNPLSLPKTLDFRIFVDAWNQAKFSYAFVNSIVATSSTLLIIIFTASFAAFALSRFDFKARNLILIIFISSQVVSNQIVLIPLFTMFRDLKMLDKLSSVIFADAAFGIPLSVYLFWDFFKTIPFEIDDSAQMDGCSRWKYYWNILLPLSKPVLASVVIFESLFTWNEYLFALTFLKSETVRTIPIQLSVFFQIFTTEYPDLFAALTIAVGPILILYIITQKSFIKGLMAGSIKG